MMRAAFLAIFLLWLGAGPLRAQQVAHPPTVVFTLRSGVAEGRLVFIGQGGDIDGKVNPELLLHQGERAQINLINGEGAEHDVVVEIYDVRSNRVVGKGASSAVSFIADKPGDFAYYCSVSGHRAAGMQGKIRVEPGPRAGLKPIAPDISRDPADLPPPFTRGRRRLCASISPASK